MAARIEDYAMIGNRETAALVCHNGSIDWLCAPRFDSPACFAALLGDEGHGRWLLAADEPDVRTHRRYRENTLILETIHEGRHGTAMVTDFMTRGEDHTYVMRRVTGLAGGLRLRGELTVRFDYGATVPWASRLADGRMEYIAGPDRLTLESPVPFANRNMRSTAAFSVEAGQVLDFALGWSPSYRPPPAPRDVGAELAQCEAAWRDWSSGFSGAGRYSAAVMRSLITLHALAHYETGGIVAAVTTSLPEQIGGSRNWDYRYCWLRDATLTLYALMESNYVDDAANWRHWLVRAIAGSPAQLQIMYGVAGEKWLAESELPWLPGYESSKPVRIGNDAARQMQLDIYGEIMDTLYLARRKGLPEDEQVWRIQCQMLAHLMDIWREPDHGIWEVRGPKRHFTHSKLMAWVAFDRAIRTAEEFNREGPADEWRRAAQEIHAEICARGFDAKTGSFVQYYGAEQVDASLLMISLTGFLPADDPRVAGTVRRIEETLMRDGLVRRYLAESGIDGLHAGDSAFLACSFWLVDNYVLLGRLRDAERLFARLLSLRNDVGLLAEEYDTHQGRQVGNFPQAFSHISLINSAYNLARAGGPAAQRAKGKAARRR